MSLFKQCMVLCILVATTGLNAFGQYEAYEVLLNAPDISPSVTWYSDNSTLPVAYADWSDQQKADLRAIIESLEAGEAYPMDAPPQLVTSYYISRDDAWTIFLSHIAHSLWVEVNQKVPWSILEYEKENLDLLFDGSLMFSCPGVDTCVFNTSTYGRVTDWNVRLTYDFLSQQGMIRETAEETLWAFTYWGRRNLVHILGADSNPDGYERLYGYRGYPLLNRILDPLPGKTHITAGCWGTAGVFKGVLRAVNIPVRSTTTHFGSPSNDSRALHSRFEMPTIGVGTTHGDDIYNGWLRPTKNNNVHSSFVFHPIQWLDDFIDDPKELDCNDSWCNSPEDQAAFNKDKYVKRIAAFYFSDTMMRYRTSNGTEDILPDSYLNALKGVSIGGQTHIFAVPFFTDDEIDDITKRLDDEVRRIGEGSWDEGRSRLLFDSPSLLDEEPSLSAYAPFADFTYTRESPEVLHISFFGEVLGDVQGLRWDFGDGESSTNLNPTHVYTFADTFNVSFTANGPGGTSEITSSLVVEGVDGVPLPDPVTLDTPLSGTTLSSVSIEFTWMELPAAVRYHIQLAEDPSFAGIVFEENAHPTTAIIVDSLSEASAYYWRVRAKNEAGAGSWSKVSQFTVSTGTATESISSELPATFSLNQNYPNPFNPTTTMRFDVPAASHVRLTVYDLLGRKVADLVDRVLEAGSHQLMFDASHLPGGVYVYQLESEGILLSEKMVLLK
ncbi:MAG: T9SS type A sorting domain-containing protein [Rhodothermaceae bacterium]|nr:T9SS type A sorting domain-containing protein [Rhodothermaceae bacterium]